MMSIEDSNIKIPEFIRPLPAQAAATATRTQRAVKPYHVGGGVNFTSGGGGMDDELMSLPDYLSLKARIRLLEKKNAYLSHRVSLLSKRLGINRGSKKIKILSLIERGLTAKEIKAQAKCSLSLVYEYMSDYKKSQQKD